MMMCATYQLSFDDIAEIKKISDEITMKYGSDVADRSFNSDFFPKNEAPVIGKKNQIVMLKWGFPLKGTSKIVYNARSESLAEKNMYKGILSNRCLVPATSFYEWDKAKRKYRISIASTKLFYMAALWRAEMLSDNSKAYYFTIVTTEPNRLIGEIHNRMPAIIAPENTHIWLNENDEAFKLLRPYEAEMAMVAV
jgi:putative SOS response-associated peptidase YedK